MHQVSVLRDINLVVAEGEFMCLLGPSGSGKSTLLNIVAGFERPTSGVVTVKGEKVDRPDPGRGVVFQSDGALFDWLTAYRNVELPLVVKGVPPRERKETIEYCLSLVKLTDAGDKYPHQLSGGMRQRLQIARVLANQPQILLMDEPFGSLDSQTRRQMQGELARIWSSYKKTVLFITHDIDEAITLGDKVAVLSEGPAAHIEAEIPIDLPRPRTRSPEFLRAWRRIDSILSKEGCDGRPIGIE
jgi:NitT/TauT family transport system ATP-binding protein